MYDQFMRNRQHIKIVCFGLCLVTQHLFESLKNIDFWRFSKSAKGETFLDLVNKRKMKKYNKFNKIMRTELPTEKTFLFSQKGKIQ